MKLLTTITLIVALLALGLAGFAFDKASKAKQLALMDIDVKERNTLMTPLFDQESEQWKFLAIYEIGITNNGATDVQLETISKSPDFLVALIGGEISTKNIAANAFVLEPSLSQIQQNPKLLKEIVNKDMGGEHALNLDIEAGKTKTVRFGLSIDAYSADKSIEANMILVSFQLDYKNGKTTQFRRGIPIAAISQPE